MCFATSATRAATLAAALLLSLLPRPAAAEEIPISPEEVSRGYRARTLLAKPRHDLAAVEQIEAGERLRLVRSHRQLGGLRVLETDGREDIKAVISRLDASRHYEYVEPDYIRRAQIVPDDPRFAEEQWALNNTGQAGGTAGADIKAAAAWELQREAPDVIVAVIDSGARLDHQDLNGNLWRNAGELGGRATVDDDGNGYVDDLFGINTTVARSADGAGEPWDTDGHGSHVAGIIGAIGNNGTGITGVAWKVQIMPLKFLGTFGGPISAEVACIDYAIAKKAHIINASFSSAAFSQAEFDALKRARDAGIIVVAAAGNDSQEITDFPQYPAAHKLDNIVAVASTTRLDKLASYSAFGSGLVELAAPGSSILSLGNSSPSAYATKSGTSMAAPHVAGALALLKQKYPNDNYRALINRLLGSVEMLPSLDHRVHTNGRLNLLAALNSTDTRPFNDDFARRAVITGEFNTVRGSNQFATTESGEPDHGVAGSGRSLWWSWTAPAGLGKVTLATAGSEIDTVLAVYTATAGAPPALGSLQRVTFNDDSEGATSSSVTFAPAAGTTYFIAVAGKGAAEGLVTFNLTGVPLNDAFAQARLLAGPSVVAEANNAFATAETGEPAKARNARGTALGSDHTLWFKWVAPETRPFQISAHGIMTDPVISLFGGTTLAALAEIASDDDSGPGLDSLVRFVAAAGGTYYIRVDSAGGAAGRFTLSIADAAWQYVSDYPGYASPAIGADRTIYFPDGFGYVHAVNPDGSRKWRSSAVDGYILGGALSIAPDGTVYTGDHFGYLYAINPADGAKKWEFGTGNLIWAAPAVAADGTVYVKSDDGKLYAVNPDGTKKWQAAVPGDTYSAPVVGADGTIYIAAGDDSALYALNPDGSEKWRASLAATVYASPAIGSDGTLYLGNYDGRFFALRPDGTERWHFDTGSPLTGSAVIDARGTVYFGSYDKKLYALDGATGAKKWDYLTGDIIRTTTPVLADDGTIYVGSSDGLVYAINADGTLLRTYATAAEIYSSPVLAAGRLYVSSWDAKLYAFDTGNNPARSPWPMHRQNWRRLGRNQDLPGIPTISTQPVAPPNATAGVAVTLSAAATLAGSTGPSYQWLFNDTPIAGATSATLTIASAQGSDAGVYRVLAIGPGGAVLSAPTTLTIAAGATNDSRLINLAVRTNAGSGDRVLFVGFAVGGGSAGAAKPLLVRAVGPTLGAFGVVGMLADPKLQIFSGTTLLLENDDWSGDAQVSSVTPQVGAFALANATSKDAAVFTTRSAGSYTAQISGASTATGVVLAEIYDATPVDTFTANTPRLVNVSARTLVGTGSNILIAGFVIGGTSAKNVLVRAIGPTLSSFGVTGVLADPKLELFQSGGTTAISSNDNWGAASNAAQVAAAAASVGAFPLALESKDAVLLVTLPPGTYTAQVSGVANGTGAAIVEVYEVP